MRNTVFNHPLSSSSNVDLPLLVPSFSSKGFDFFEDRKAKKKRSVSSYALEQFGPYLNESYLLSAYDIHHEHFREPQAFYENTALIFLDSGGYELNPDFDSTEPKITATMDLDFTRDDYINILDSLYSEYKHLPFVIANYDWGTKSKPYSEQIESARDLFHRYPKWASNFILKPDTPDSNRLHIKNIFPIIDELRDFDIVGVTEKELGKDLMARLKLLASLRQQLSKSNISSPIHMWGGLDPIVTPVYFFAGADIFDGISWLRYAYVEGMAVNRDCFSILDEDITESYDQSIMMAINKNLSVLRGLATGMRAFISSQEPNFDMFEYKAKVFENAYNTMLTKIPELKEGL